MGKRYTEDFAELLRELRLKEGLTQRDVAESVGVPLATEQGWEHRYSLPKAKNWKSFKERYGTHEIFSALEKAYLTGKRLSRV